tara:strand:- start:186 stop:530 length:345 start_codon:yes stop_codon:yes gene_type:complete
MEFQGKLDFVGEVQQISEKFAKREIWLNTEGDYPQTVNFQLVNDKCDLIDPFNIGDELKLFFNLRGRKWVNPKTDEEKCFNTLDAWKIEAVATQSEAVPEALKYDEKEGNDLPF